MEKLLSKSGGDNLASTLSRHTANIALVPSLGKHENVYMKITPTLCEHHFPYRDNSKTRCCMCLINILIQEFSTGGKPAWVNSSKLSKIDPWSTDGLQ